MARSSRGRAVLCSSPAAMASLEAPRASGRTIRVGSHDVRSMSCALRRRGSRPVRSPTASTSRPRPPTTTSSTSTPRSAFRRGPRPHSGPCSTRSSSEWQRSDAVGPPTTAAAIPLVSRAVQSSPREESDLRAIVVTEKGGPEVLELRDEPDPEPGPGQLLVDVEAIGVNFRDIYEREGAGAYASEPPFVAGAEGAGTVAAVGDGVHDFSVGDRVAWAAAPGSYAERVVVDDGAAGAGPRRVGPEIAAGGGPPGRAAPPPRARHAPGAP